MIVARGDSATYELGISLSDEIVHDNFFLWILTASFLVVTAGVFIWLKNKSSFEVDMQNLKYKSQTDESVAAETTEKEVEIIE